jgi:hypothetical protein
MGQSKDDITDRIARGVQIAYDLRTRYRDQVMGAWVNGYENQIVLFTADPEFSYEGTFPGYSIGNLPAAELPRMQPVLKTKGAVLQFVDAQQYVLERCKPKGDA